MATKKELQVALIERDRITDALKRLEENYRAGKVTKLDYKILHERYEGKLKELDQRLGVKEEEKKPRKHAGFRFWRKKSS